MKLVRRAIVLVAVILALLLVAVFVTSNDVSNTYATLKIARSERLFERGWLPDILPPSAQNIKVSNNLDLNDSSGQFEFRPEEYAAFVANTVPYQPIKSPFSAFENTVARKKKKGLVPLTVDHQHAVWVFFCDPLRGRCEYIMWSRKS